MILWNTLRCVCGINLFEHKNYQQDGNVCVQWSAFRRVCGPFLRSTSLSAFAGYKMCMAVWATWHRWCRFVTVQPEIGRLHTCIVCVVEVKRSGAQVSRSWGLYAWILSVWGCEDLLGVSSGTPSSLLCVAISFTEMLELLVRTHYSLATKWVQGHMWASLCSYTTQTYPN